MNYYIERVSSIVAAAILLQTLYFKFSAAPESVYIFSQLHLEPYGRIGVGMLELFVSLLLLFRRTSVWGSLLGLGVILGAILSHVFVLGIEVRDDGGLLFVLALTVFVLCLVSLILQKEKVLSFFFMSRPKTA